MKTLYLSIIALFCVPGIQAQSVLFRPMFDEGDQPPFDISIYIDTVQQLSQSKGIAFVLELSNPSDTIVEP